MEIIDTILLSDTEESNGPFKTEIKDIIHQFKDINQKNNQQINNIEKYKNSLNHSFNNILKKLDIMQNDINTFQHIKNKRSKTTKQNLLNPEIINLDLKSNKGTKQEVIISLEEDSLKENENLTHKRNLKILCNLVIHYSFDKISKIVSNLDTLIHKKRFSDNEEKQIVLKLKQIKGQENINQIIRKIYTELSKKITKEEEKKNYNPKKEKNLSYKAEKEIVGQKLSEKGINFTLKKHFFFCVPKNIIYCYNNPRLNGVIRKYTAFKCIEKNCNAKLLCIMGKYRPIFQGKHTEHGGINRNWLIRKYKELDNKKWTHAQIAKMNGEEFVLYKY